MSEDIAQKTLLDDISITGFLDNFSEEIRAGTAAIFAGAGLSVPTGYVDWKRLLAPIARDLELDVDRERLI